MLVILSDIPVGLIEQLIVGVQLVLLQRLSQGQLYLAFSLGCALPAVKAHLPHNRVDVGDEALDNDMRLFALHFVEELRQRG